MTTQGHKTGKPREIEIWFTARNGRFYLIAEHETSNWVKNIRASSEVQVRVAGQNYAATARVVSKNDELELHTAVCELSREKYGWGEGLVIEILPSNTE